MIAGDRDGTSVPDLPGGGDAPGPPSPSPICPKSGTLPRPHPRFAEIGDQAASALPALNLNPIRVHESIISSDRAGTEYGRLPWLAAATVPSQALSSRAPGLPNVERRLGLGGPAWHMGRRLLSY